jgi:hypothetical protein
MSTLTTVVAVLLVLLSVAATYAQTPNKPTSLAQTFGAAIELVVDPLGNGVLMPMNGSIYYDQAGSQVEMDLYSSVFNQDFHFTSFELATNSFEVVNGVCRVGHKNFSSWFNWIFSPAAVFAGVTVTASGATCNNWLLVASPNVRLQACADATFIYSLVVSGTGKPVNITFSQQSALPSTPVVVPKSCSRPPPVCPSAPWTRLSIFRLHNINDTELAQRNAASLIGDLYYICSALVANSPIAGNGTVISLLQIAANTTWGQYALCNHGICVGGDNVTVGHEATAGFTLGGGQCQQHNNIGDWYSLTAASQCAPNVTVPSTDCAWQFVKRVKSVSMQCLVGAGLAQMCAADIANGGFPFQKSAALVTSTLQSNKLCPDSPPPIATNK